jgi:iron complex outermembrane receptor protein
MQNYRFLSSRLMAGAAMAGLLAGVSAPALAATTVATVDQAAPAPGEVVVTARKRSEKLIDAPLAITALSATSLEQHDVTDIYGLSSFTPGLKVENEVVNRNDRTFHTYTIRGIYPGSDSPERQTVTVFMDGVPVDGDIEGLDNIQQVEVINGPQSAYFGRSTFAGAINLITRAPSFKPEVYTSGSYASFGTYEWKGSVEGGLIADKLSGRLSVRDFHTAGDYANAAEPGATLGERDTKSVSLALNYLPTDKLTIKGFAEAWQDSDGPHASAQLQPADFNCKTPTGIAYFCGALSKIPSQDIGQQTVVPSTVIAAIAGKTGRVSTVYTPTLDHFGMDRLAYEGHVSADYKLPYGFSLDGNVAYDYDRYEFITDTGFRSGLNNVNPNYGTVAGTAAGVLPYYSRSVLGQNAVEDTSAEVRLSSPADQPLKGMLGFNYFHLNSAAVTNAFGNTGLSVPTNLNINTANTYGLFGSASYDFGHGFSISAEGRYQIERIGSAVLPSLSVPAGGVDAVGVFKSFTPRIIGDYKPTRDVTLYISYSEGTRPGAFNTLFYSLPAASQAAIRQQVTPQLAVPEEHLNMEEAGVKGEFLNRTVTILADVYMGQWRNRQIPEQVAYLNGATFLTTQITVPNGAVDLSGVELQGTWRATPELTFNGTFDYSKTALKNSFDTGALALLGVNFVANNSLPRYPITSASASMHYERPTFGDYNGFFNLDYTFTGRQYDSETNLAWTPDASKVNLSLGIQDSRYRLEFFATNILNDKTPITLSRGNDTYTTANVITTAPPEPAAVGVRGSAKFF